MTEALSEASSCSARDFADALAAVVIDAEGKPREGGKYDRNLVATCSRNGGKPAKSIVKGRER